MTEEQLSQLAEALSGVGGWLLDGATLHFQWTAQAYRLHGLTPGTPAPALDGVLALVAEADRERVRTAWLGALGQGRGCDLVYALELPQGQRRRLRCQTDFRLDSKGRPQLAGALQALPDATLGPPGTSLEFAVAAAGVGAWEMDLVTGEEHWSDQTLRLYGLPPGSRAPSRSEWKARFVLPEEHARIDARAAEFMANRRPYEMDYRIRRADDGTVRWMHSRAVFANGGDRLVLGVTLDITEERAAEERARQATQLLEHASTQVGFGFGYRVPGGEAGYWSVQLKRMFGLADDAPTPNRAHLGTLISPQDRERVLGELTQPLQPGEVREFEFEVMRGPGGQPCTLTTRAATEYDASGRPVRTYFALMDVTDLRRKDRQLNQLLSRLQLATEASGVGTWERDARTGRNQWDAITLGLFDLPPGVPPLDRPEFLQRVLAEDRARVAEVLARADQDLKPFDVDYRVSRPDGSLRWLRTRGRVELGDDGQPLRSIGVCFDTTAQRLAESAQQARALAEQANAAKTEFLSRMSHELRTPLNAVLGFAQLLSLDEVHELNPTQRERVDHIQSAGWHLLALVNDVLDLSRIESRQAQMVCERVQLPQAVQGAMHMVASSAQAHKVTMAWLPPAEAVPALWVDATRLKQVLLNLLSNGIKYNRPQGRVEVSARPGAAGTVCITVRDTGLGMSAEQLGRLFEPFNRLGREASQVEGTGLGLALCKIILEQMGGRIEVSSQPGQGSEFRVILPAATPD